MGSVQLTSGQNMELDPAQRASSLLKNLICRQPALSRHLGKLRSIAAGIIPAPSGVTSTYRLSTLPRRFIARLASEIFLTSLQTAFFNNLLEHSWRITGQKGTTPWTPHTGSDTDPSDSSQ